ncbi:mitochondrial ribosomal protein L6 [Myxozyma melibiosi]|uniref:Mitochondrial ribosomal protein L6 n=1 Tax=Myxozyma melibiosi TaxID=54550 RepID=A0ABR1FDH6_9ASCO
MMQCARTSVLFSARRHFSASAVARSHIGSTPIVVPPEVSFALDPYSRDPERDEIPLIITGPKGVGKVAIPPFARLELVEEGRKLEVRVEDTTEKRQRQMWGTLRSLINNHVMGVTIGHSVILTLTGTGYRAELLGGGRKISVKVGQTGATLLNIPVGINAICPQPTRVLLKGSDKQLVTQFAATIRALKPPEPYKGKGIFVNNETIKLKSKSVK